jgi:Tol biopolymer transport system component
MVAWVDSGNLIVWQTGDALPRRIASGGVIRPYIAPDGAHIAFTRGPNGAPITLWSIDSNGIAEQKLIGEGNPRRYQESEHQIGDVVWYTADTLYLNTLRRAAPAYQPVNDLYRANIRTREAALLLSAGEGGRMSISPDRAWIAVASSGTYGVQDGRIRVLEPLAQREPRDLLYFVGVATGSHTPFYPSLYWSADSSAIFTAIPDKDLIYSDTAEAANLPLTRLWRLPIRNPSERELLNSQPMSFFGLPRWSADATQMVYLRRVPQTNTFTIMTAVGDGNESVAYASGAAGTIALPEWLPATNQFVYPQGNLGQVLIGASGQTPQALTGEVVYTPQFVTSELYVFVTSAAVAADGFLLRYAQMGQASQPIGNVGAKIPLYDARWIAP